MIKFDAENSLTRGSDGWVAPETNQKGLVLKPSIDVFILGCFYFYVLSKDHTHPFGLSVLRGGYICDENYSVYESKWNGSKSDCNGSMQDEKALDLIKKMIKFERDERITLDKVLDDAYFKPVGEYQLYDRKDGAKPGLCVVVSQEEFYNVTNTL